MNLRTITCWTVYHPARRRILKGFRTRAEFKRYYSAGVPIGCVLVKMRGHYVPPSTRKA